MSCIAIGDIHGRDLWKYIVQKHPNDQVVFVGDYFDSKDKISAENQIKNFSNILAYKKQYADRVTLLLGNHDYHYLPEAENEHYSGYQSNRAPNIMEILAPAVWEGWIEICKKHGSYLISHAGITQTWCKTHQVTSKDPETEINQLFIKNPGAFGFSPGAKNDVSGNEPEQGPLWVRPQSLKEDQLPGFIQVVGHTQTPFILTDASPILIDIFGYSPKYLEIKDDGKAQVLGIW